MVWDAMVAVGSSPDADPAKRTRLPHIPITVSLIGKQSTLKLRTGIWGEWHDYLSDIITGGGAQ